VEQIICHVSHEVLRTIGGAENYRSRLPQTSHNRRVFGGDTAAVHQAADLAAMAGGRDGRLHRYWKAGERPERDGRAVNRPRPLTYALRIEIYQGIDLGIQPLDLADVFVGQFEG